MYSAQLYVWLVFLAVRARGALFCPANAGSASKHENHYFFKTFNHQHSLHKHIVSKMPVHEIVGSSLLVLILSLAAMLIVNMIVNLFLGGGPKKAIDLQQQPMAAPAEDDNDKAENDSSEPTTKANTEGNDSSEPTAEANTEESSPENNWRCACEGGFLPAGMLKSFGGAEAVMRLGTGQCYHK